MLDPFAQLFQHCWGHARPLRMLYKDLWVVSFLRCTASLNFLSARANQMFQKRTVFVFTESLSRFQLIQTAYYVYLVDFVHFCYTLDKFCGSPIRVLRAGDTESLDSFFASADRPYAS